MMVRGADASGPLPWSGMQPLRWDRRPDGLRAPALVCAFKGWNDAGESASSALTFLGAGLGAERFAVIDPEEFVDFQATRPTVRLSGGDHRVIEWPDIEVHEARIPRAPRDLVIVSGPEPAYRWRTFCETVVELAEALGVQMVVTLGALLADVPHSRPVSVTAFASDEALVERLGLDRRPTRDRPGSSACCTRRARRRHAERVAVGRGPALRGRRAEPEGLAGAAAPAREPDRRHGRRRRARGCAGRVRAPGLARGRDGP